MSKSLIIVLIVFAGIIGLGFYFEWPAITNNWPFLIFLLCPIMHFMGHCHGSGHSHTSSKSENLDEPNKKCH